jgi:uncharacterized protein (TIGR01777 family)
VATVLLSGASGFIGSRLAESFAADGHDVVPLVRRQTRSRRFADAIAWDPEAGTIDRAELARVAPQVVVNLAGEPIARRWTPARRRRIRESRVQGTMAIATAIAALPTPPSVFVSGSAIGVYGAHRGDTFLDEDSAPGDDYLAHTAVAWEEATSLASRAGVRVVHARTGIVLGHGGGVLARMLPPFRLGLGGRLGSGDQWMSWIALGDMVRGLRFITDTPALHGPVNLVAPEPARNAEFTRTLARVLGRPAVFPVPAMALKLAFGEMAEHTILASQRVVPKRLAGAGFSFRHPRLEDALRVELRR